MNLVFWYNDWVSVQSKITQKEVDFRPMVDQDISALVQIDLVSNSACWTQKMFERELELPFSLSLVATVSGRPVAFIVGWLVADSAQLLQFAVDPEYRRQGLGERLLNLFMSAAQKKGFKNAELEVASTNIKAKRFYEKFGFTATGKRKDFYPGSDALLMEKPL